MTPLGQGTVGWLLGQLAVIALAALALKLSVGLVSSRIAARNDLSRAAAVAGALHLFSIACRSLAAQHQLDVWIPTAIMLLVWGLVVRWAYRLNVVQTVLVAVVMLVIMWLAIALLSIGLAAARSALPWA